MTESGQTEPDIDRAVSEHPIWASRGKAIQSYALLEHWLCRVLGAVTGMNAQAAATIFFKITAKRVARDTLGELVSLRYEKRYDNSWNSYSKGLADIGTKR